MEIECTNMTLRLSVLIFLISVGSAQAQENKREIFRDTLDHAFDVSRFLIELKGFVAVPFIITEPALGSFGGGLGLIFLTRRKPLVDTIRGEVKVIPIPPDISGGGGFYSANQSWGAIGFRSGMWTKPRIRYRIVAGYVDLNLSLYRTIAGEDREFEFNFKTVP